MLSDLNYDFIYKGNEYFEKEIQNIVKDGHYSIEAVIVSYFKDEKGNIKRFIRRNSTDIKDINLNSDELLSKYYILKLSYDFEPYIGTEYDTIIKIINIGDFEIISDKEVLTDDLDNNSVELFKNYDSLFSTMEFPFTDDEFLEKNTKVLGLNYDGLFIR